MDLDYTGLKCPQPILKLTIAARKITAGTTVNIVADCSTFPGDVKKWCERQGKVLMALNELGDGKTQVQIQF